jgi:hypothetical protein
MLNYVYTMFLEKELVGESVLVVGETLLLETVFVGEVARDDGLEFVFVFVCCGVLVWVWVVGKHWVGRVTGNSGAWCRER